MQKLLHIIVSKFGSREGILDIRVRIAKIFFVFSVLIFSLNYFFVAGGFYDEIFSYMIPYTYVVFVISFVFSVHLILTQKYLINKTIWPQVGLLIVLLIIASLAIFSLFL